MKIKNNFLFILFTLSGSFMCAMDVVKKQDESVHVVYSPAWCEDTTREIFKRRGQPEDDNQQDEIDLKGTDFVMTFEKGNSFTTEKSKKTIYVGDDKTTFCNSYAMHFAGFGDSLSVPAYTDASTKWYVTLSKTALYTRRNVLVLAQHLRDRVIKEKRSKVLLIGPCVGASIAIECLKMLITFEQNPDYFKGTDITLHDARAIIAAINKGGFVAMVPLMSVKKHNAVAFPAALLSGLTLTAVTAALYHYAGPAMAQHSQVVRAGLLGAGLLTYSALEDSVKNAYASLIKYTVVPLLSRFNYNPFHEDPIDNIECLRGEITGPVAVDFSMQDWVMQWKNEDLFRLYDALNWKRFNAQVVITHDKGHMEISPAFLENLKKRFTEKMDLPEEWDTEEVWNDCAIEHRRSLQKKIYPYGIFSKLFALKKLAVDIMFLCLTPILLKFIQA